MKDVLRQRVEDRLEYDGIKYQAVKTGPGRIICEGMGNAELTAEKLAELPGVASTSPAYMTDSDLERIKEKTDNIEIGETFGVKANRAGEHEFDSRDVNREVGAYIQEKTGAEVDLDNPETWVEIDVRFEDSYIFDERFEGPDGFPSGTSEDMAALISGGIDSPVAAYEVMKRGADILPIYFYNKPVAAEDHFLRFKSVVKKLKRFNPAPDWNAYKIDMQEVNEQLIDEIGRGRMVVHRRIMFRVAEKIAEEEGLTGIVTGEALSQKSSQTASNLELTSKSVNKPIFRPLFTDSKLEITAKARDIGTYEDAKIASACSSMSPESPATRISEEEIRELEERIDVDKLVEKTFDNAEIIEF